MQFANWAISLGIIRILKIFTEMVGFSALMLFVFHYDLDNIHLSHHLSNKTKHHSPFYFYYHITAFSSISKPMPLLISLCLLCFVWPPLNYIAYFILYLRYLHDCMDKSNLLLLPALRTLRTIKNVVNTTHKFDVFWKYSHIDSEHITL